MLLVNFKVILLVCAIVHFRSAVALPGRHPPLFPQCGAGRYVQRTLKGREAAIQCPYTGIDDGSLTCNRSALEILLRLRAGPGWFHLKMDDALLFFQKDMGLFAVRCARADKRQIRTPGGRPGPAAMTSPPVSFAAYMQAQRAEFRSAFPARLAQIESLWCQVRDGQAPALADLERCAHGLAGSGATFGFSALGDAARVLEMAVSPWAGAAHALTPAAQAELGLAVDVFCRSLSAEIGIQGD